MLEILYNLEQFIIACSVVLITIKIWEVSIYKIHAGFFSQTYSQVYATSEIQLDSTHNSIESKNTEILYLIRWK